MEQDRNINPLDDLLRARLRIEGGSQLKIRAIRLLMQAIDSVNRVTTGQPFFATREVEEILIELGDRKGIELIQALLDMKGGTTLTAHGLDNVPSEGPVIIGSTHPIGTFDYISHAGILLKHRSDLKVVAGRESERFLGSDHLIAVDLDGRDKVRSPRQTISGMEEHLQRGGALVVFGSGRVPKMEKGLLVERPWRTGITRVSRACDAQIVPASTSMRNTPHYYRTRRLAGFLSGGNDDFGRTVASLRYASELIAKLGGSYEVHYAPAEPPGTAPERLKEIAEGLVPGLYLPA